ncbi:MarR family transcriptional regulator [Aureimonas sp. AU40]|uniref:MarR family transcriptional regulator n=1 Tax=Aureimonas sp. AU40 TaxID=1637747 RepID=UPI0012E33415|nr:MarR family transcriptional regulator [Aureimonas sp. AU40]
MELLFGEFLTAYEATKEERPSIARSEHISIATSRIFGRSAFSMKSVLDGYAGLNLERARTLVSLHQIGGKGSLGEVKEAMGLTRQAAYSRLQALCAGGYAEKRATAYGMYFITQKGSEAAEQIAALD